MAHAMFDPSSLCRAERPAEVPGVGFGSVAVSAGAAHFDFQGYPRQPWRTRGTRVPVRAAVRVLSWVRDDAGRDWIVVDVADHQPEVRVGPDGTREEPALEQGAVALTCPVEVLDERLLDLLHRRRQPGR